MTIGTDLVAPWRAHDEVVIDLRSEEAVMADACDEPAACADVREVFVDVGALGLDHDAGGVWLRYDYDEVTRTLSRADLLVERELSLAVRLVISEVGADRLLLNRFGVGEAMGILFTVDNRLDPRVYNVIDEAVAPVFPGCGVHGSFAACANAQQYLGMGTWRALEPALRYDPTLLEPAVDLAVTAWWLQEQGLVDDFTDGATNYVHRCGGAAYGLPTMRCDAHIGNSARDDVPGANPHTGPIVFRGPTTWNARRGVYDIAESRRLEYEPWWRVEEWGLGGDALADAAPHAETLAPDVVRVRLDVGDDPIAATGDLARVVSGLGPALDPETIRRLLR